MEGRRSLGARGEDAAARALEAAGLRVVARNLRTKAGEIDLLVLDGDTLVAVEVKTRAGERFGRPEEAAGRRRIDRLRRATEAYAASRGLPPGPMRVDVVAVRAEADGRLVCEHIPGVDG